MLIRNSLAALALCAAALTGCRDAEPTAPPPEPTSAAATDTAPAATATETATATEAAAGHDVTGAYMPIEPWPADFAELDFLSLATIDENAAPAPLNGFLRPKKFEAADYKLVAPKLEGKRLTFTSQTVGGVSYAFTGEFQVLDNFPANPPAYETTVLTGTLTKQRDGKTVAETPVKFRYEAGG